MMWLADHAAEITLYAIALAVFATTLAYDRRNR